MREKIKKILLVLFGLIVCINLALLDFWLIKVNNQFLSFSSETYKKQGSLENILKTLKSTSDSKIFQDACDSDCQKQIIQKVKDEVVRIPSPTSVISKISPAVGQENFGARVIYVPLITNGAVSSMNWTDIVPSEFYFDLKDYPEVKEIRLVAYLLSVNNDMGFARLYDNTNKRWAYFSDVQTNNSSFTRVESKPIELLKGNNKYTVQLRSVNATQVQLKDAKLKIVF